MLLALLAIGAGLCALLALSAKRLLSSAIWLAGTSALSAILFYLLGAYEVAVIELSVGVGLVTILFVFAISIAGDESMDAKPVVPRLLAGLLVMLAIVLLGWLVLPEVHAGTAQVEATSTHILWEQRGLDMLVQMALIFAGALTVLGLLIPIPDKRRLPEKIHSSPPQEGTRT